MKVLIAGATGTIGSAILRHCLDYSDITSIVTLTRRHLPPQSPKCTNIVVNDWKNWDANILASIADADAMIWAIGTQDANRDTNYNFIIAFQEAFRKVMRVDRQKRFRYIFVSGALVEPDQNKTLYLKAEARKLKGRADNWTLDFAQKHRNVWQTWIVRPGMLSTNAILRKLAGMLIPIIEDEQIGAFVADLVVHGNEPEGVILNPRMLTRGTELLALK
jgi:nucleoside-diphosphate-sugar epimerase